VQEGCGIETTARFRNPPTLPVGDLPGLDAEQAEAELENSLTALLNAGRNSPSQQNVLKSLITDDFLHLAEVNLEPADTLIAVAQQ
jgi:hypothetical protein